MRFLSSAANTFRRSDSRDEGGRELARAFEQLEIELTALRAIVSVIGAKQDVDRSEVEEYVRKTNFRTEGVPTDWHIKHVMERVEEVLSPRA